MPLTALLDKQGNAIPLEDVNPVDDAPALGASPATIQSILRSTRKRDHLGDTFSASMIGKPARQLYLEETTPFAKSVGEFMAGEFGTMKHGAINVSGDRIIANVRVWSKKYPWLSGELDNAAIVEIEETDEAVTFVLDLFDLKSGGFYGARLHAADPWGEKAHTEYSWQVNCLAALLEDCDAYDPGNFEVAQALFAAYYADPGRTSYAGRTWRIRVRNLYIEWAPRDTDYTNQKEAQKAGIADHRLFLVNVPRKSPEEVYAKYEAGRAAQLAARANNYAPICADTWLTSGPKAVKFFGKPTHLRCMMYCSVRDACVRMSMERGEANHNYTEEQALRASLRQRGWAVTDEQLLRLADGETKQATAESPNCRACNHSWGSHCYDKAGNELPDSGPCNECECKGFV